MKAIGKPGATVKQAVNIAKTAKEATTLPKDIALSGVRSGVRPKTKEESGNGDQHICDTRCRYCRE
jgi:hypothetical protein